jgi:cobalt-zinc-cadmium efflux system protein
MRGAANMALDAVPPGIDAAAVRSFLSSLSGVREVHDLHIWAMSTTETALTVHLVRTNGKVDDAFLTEVAQELDRRFGIIIRPSRSRPANKSAGSRPRTSCDRQRPFTY